MADGDSGQVTSAAHCARFTTIRCANLSPTISSSSWASSS